MERETGELGGGRGATPELQLKLSGNLLKSCFFFVAEKVADDRSNLPAMPRLRNHKTWAIRTSFENTNLITAVCSAVVTPVWCSHWTLFVYISAEMNESTPLSAR